MPVLVTSSRATVPARATVTVTATLAATLTAMLTEINPHALVCFWWRHSERDSSLVVFQLEQFSRCRVWVRRHMERDGNKESMPKQRRHRRTCSWSGLKWEREREHQRYRPAFCRCLSVCCCCHCRCLCWQRSQPMRLGFHSCCERASLRMSMHVSLSVTPDMMTSLFIDWNQVPDLMTSRRVRPVNRKISYAINNDMLIKAGNW